MVSLADHMSSHDWPKRAHPLRRWLPIAVLGVLVAVAYGSGLGSYLTLAQVAEHRHWLKAFAAEHLMLGLLIFGAVYVAVVALSVPGAALLSIFGGFLFDWWLSAPVTVIAATAGAAVVFQAVKTSVGDSLAERAGPTYRKLHAGLAADAFNFLLFLRLVPAFPFFIVNAVAGLSGMRLSTFAAATVLGIIPGSAVFAYFGSGLDSIIMAQEAAFRTCVAEKGAGQCSFEIDPGALITGQVLVALAALSLLALVPVVIRHWRPRG